MVYKVFNELRAFLAWIFIGKPRALFVPPVPGIDHERIERLSKALTEKVCSKRAPITTSFISIDTDDDSQNKEAVIETIPLMQSLSQEVLDLLKDEAFLKEAKEAYLKKAAELDQEQSLIVKKKVPAKRKSTRAAGTQVAPLTAKRATKAPNKGKKYK